MENFVFISYQSNDVEWAKWLEHELDFYHLPPNLDPNEKTLHGEKNRDNLRDVFWDSRLAAGALDEGIKRKLESSANLIVICSPNSANVKEHPWVNEEIKYFIELGKLDHIFPFIVEGKEPKEFFPPALLNLPPNKERVGGNVNKDGKDAAFVKIVAGMLDVDVDILWQHYEREKAEEESRKREERDRLLKVQSQFLAEKANTLVDAGDSYTACLLAMKALPHKDDKDPRPYVPSAEFALRNAFRNEQAVLRGHGNWVFAVAISSDDKWIVSGSHDETIRVWEKASGNCRFVLKGHKGIVNYVQISSDCKYIVSAGDKTIKMWSLETGEFIKDIAKYDTYVSGIAISPNNSHVYSALQYGAMKKYDLNTGNCVMSFDGHTKYIKSINISHNGNFIVSTSGDDTVKIWNVSTGKLVQDIKITSPTSAFFNSNDTKIIVSAFDGNVRIYDVSSGQQIQMFTITSGNSFIETAVFSPTDKYILSSVLDESVSGEIKIWDAQNGELIQTLTGHTSSVATLVFTNDGKSLISGSKDKTLRIWNLNIKEKPKKKGLFYTPPVVVSKALFSRDGKYIVASYWNNTLKLLNSNATIAERSFTGHTSLVTSFDLSPDEKKIASVSSDKSIILWETSTGQILKRIWPNNVRELDSVAFSPDGKILIATCDNCIKMWNVENYQLVNMLDGHKGIVNTAIFSYDGKYIISGSYDQSIIIWRKDGVKERTFVGHIGPVQHVAVYQDQDNMIIASASSDNTVRIWNGRTGDCLYILEGHKNVVTYVSFSKDGKKLLSASSDIRVWDTETGELIDVLEGHKDLVKSVVFSPDSKTILSASSDGTIKLWPFLPLQDLIDSAKERFRNRQLTKEERKKYYLE